MAELLHKRLSYELQGAAFDVRKHYGPGHKEDLYKRAFAEELEGRGITFETEKTIAIRSLKSGKILAKYQPDFVIGGKIIVEVKAVEEYIVSSLINSTITCAIATMS